MSAGDLEKHDVLSCIQCGRCTAGCPVSIRTTFNIRGTINLNLRERKKWIQPQDIWSCTTCHTCASRCPKGVGIVDYIMGLRSYQVERGKIDPAARDALESILKHGNPWGRVREKRSDWIGENKVRILQEGESTEVLLFVGCTPAYDPKAQKSAQALSRILAIAGVDFAIMGNSETCCGNEVKRMGELGLFEMLVEDNTNLFSKYKFNKLVTISPHCYNTFKNEYPNLGDKVIHYTQFLVELSEKGKLKLSNDNEAKAIFHDPCFLGKQNLIYEEPRTLLKAVLKEELLEFDRNRERSQCCEGGGGRMWIEVDSDKPRTAEERVRDAHYYGAEILATSCPFCLLTLSDAVKTAGLEDKLQVKDICSIISPGEGEKDGQT
ncbi:(Fe-S)-binding protein [bacterium]|nr:(Fe-S)-binding protein [bacterium]